MNTTTNTRGVSPCPECGGAGVYPKAAVVPPPPDVTCRKCQGSGRDYHVLSAQNTRGVSEAMVSLIHLWRQREDNGEQETEFDKGYQQASDECADALEAALSAEPAAQGEAVATVASVRAELVAKIGDCCMGGDPLCAGGCLAEKAAMRNAEREAKLAAQPAQPAERVPEGWLDEAGRLYDAVKVFPEKRGNPVLVGWDGFEGLLLLRNHVGNLLTASPAPSEGGKGVGRG